MCCVRSTAAGSHFSHDLSSDRGASRRHFPIAHAGDRRDDDIRHSKRALRQEGRMSTKWTQRLVAGAAVMALTLGLVGTADAAPPPERGFAVTAMCEHTGALSGVIMGAGAWAPVILYDGRGTRHSVGFEGFYGIVYDAEGTELYRFEDPETEYRRGYDRHPHGYERCAWSALITHEQEPEEIPPGGYGEIGGTVLVRGLPPGRH
jgi:hypothetical protein